MTRKLGGRSELGSPAIQIVIVIGFGEVRHILIYNERVGYAKNVDATLTREDNVIAIAITCSHDGVATPTAEGGRCHMATWTDASDLLRKLGFGYQSSRTFKQERNGINYYAQRITTKNGTEEWIELRSQIANVDELGFDLKANVAKYKSGFGGLALVDNELSISFRLLLVDVNQLKVSQSFEELVRNSEAFAVSLNR